MSYIKSLRRKLGVITLLMACVFVGGWVRSLHTFDMINWHRDDKTIYGAFSNRGLLSCNVLHDSQPLQIQLFSFYVTADAVSGGNCLNNAQVVKWHWKSCGFEFGETILRITGRERTFGAIPYWAIILPLTLLSASLLLSKPRTTVLEKPAELSPANGS